MPKGIGYGKRSKGSKSKPSRSGNKHQNRLLEQLGGQVGEMGDFTPPKKGPRKGGRSRSR